MVINWHGNGCFKITSGGVTLLTDPESNRFKGDIILKTTQPLPLEERYPDVIVGPGEYEIKEVEVFGYSAPADDKSLNTVYLVKAEEMRLCFFGNPKAIPSGEILEHLGEIDILFVAPAHAAAVKQLNPKIVVPAFFKTVKDVTKEFDQKVEEQEHLTIKQKELPTTIKIFALKNV